MSEVLVKVKKLRRKPFFKLVSNDSLFDNIQMDIDACVPYNHDHNLDEDSWFKVENFNQREYCIDILKDQFDSKDYDDLPKEKFGEIDYIFSVQNDDFYFQKITKSLFLRKKTIIFGDIATIENDANRLVINNQPDAIYHKNSNTLIFRSIATISSIFKGIDELYREASDPEVGSFLEKDFIELGDDYCLKKVSKPNRKRIALVMNTLDSMNDDEFGSMFDYILDYCREKLHYDEDNKKFSINTDNELKFLLYGIEQRFYTTPLSKEKRLANSVQAI